MSSWPAQEQQEIPLALSTQNLIIQQYVCDGCETLSVSKKFQIQYEKGGNF
jgi:hypothetical protein